MERASEQPLLQGYSTDSPTANSNDYYGAESASLNLTQVSSRASTAPPPS